MLKDNYNIIIVFYASETSSRTIKVEKQQFFSSFKRRKHPIIRELNKFSDKMDAVLTILNTSKTNNIFPMNCETILRKVDLSFNLWNILQSYISSHLVKYELTAFDRVIDKIQYFAE